MPTESSTAQTTRVQPAWQRGLTQATPIILGYVPIGFAYGVMAQKSGLSTAHTVGMSLIVYAGASQFIATGLFAAGIPALSIVITTFVVNLRHMLMSAAMAPHLKTWTKPQLTAFAYELTDETFAVHAARFAGHKPDRAEVFWINALAQMAWVTGSYLGTVGGQVVPDPKPWGLDFALPALFVALLVLQIRDRLQIGIALATGVLAVTFTIWGLDRWAVILATLVGATLGVIWEQWTKTRSHKTRSY